MVNIFFIPPSCTSRRGKAPISRLPLFCHFCSSLYKNSKENINLLENIKVPYLVSICGVLTFKLVGSFSEFDESWFCRKTPDFSRGQHILSIPSHNLILWPAWPSLSNDQVLCPWYLSKTKVPVIGHRIPAPFNYGFLFHRDKVNLREGFPTTCLSILPPFFDFKFMKLKKKSLFFWDLELALPFEIPCSQWTISSRSSLLIPLLFINEPVNLQKSSNG